MLNGLWLDPKTKDLPASGSAAGSLLVITVDRNELNKNLAVRLKAAAKFAFATTAASAVAVFLTSDHGRLDAGERLIGLEGRIRNSANAVKNLYLEAESGGSVTKGVSYWFVIG